MCPKATCMCLYGVERSVKMNSLAPPEPRYNNQNIYLEVKTANVSKHRRTTTSFVPWGLLSSRRPPWTQTGSEKLQNSVQRSDSIWTGPVVNLPGSDIVWVITYYAASQSLFYCKTPIIFHKPNQSASVLTATTHILSRNWCGSIQVFTGLVYFMFVQSFCH